MKWRKQQRGDHEGQRDPGQQGRFGEYGLQSLEPGRINGRQIEAGRMACSHYLGREGRVFIRIFPHKSLSKKPLETRMGTGKGEPDHWAAEVKPGTILFEIAGVDETVARRAFARVAYKMPVQCRLRAAPPHAVRNDERPEDERRKLWRPRRLKEFRKMAPDELKEREERTARPSCSSCAPARRPRRSRTPRKFQKIKKDIARIQTILREQELKNQKAKA